MGDKTELADVEICLKPDGSDWLLGIGASSRVRPVLCVSSCPLMDTSIHCGLGVYSLLFSQMHGEAAACCLHLHMPSPVLAPSRSLSGELPAGAPEVEYQQPSAVQRLSVACIWGASADCRGPPCSPLPCMLQCVAGRLSHYIPSHHSLLTTSSGWL